MAEPQWRKSSYSTATSNCVEVAELETGHVAVRDSQHPEVATLTFRTGGWAAFLSGIKNGELAP